MATVARRVCDLCGNEDGVEELIVSYRFQEGKPWGLDLCPECYELRFGGLVDLSHPIRRTQIRPQYRVRETFVTEAQLRGRPEDN